MAERSTFWVGLKSAEVYMRSKRFLSPASRFAARRKFILMIYFLPVYRLYFTRPWQFLSVQLLA